MILRQFLFGCGIVIVLSFTRSNRGVISFYYPYLIGDYALVKVVSDEGIKCSPGLKDTFQLVITKNDRLHFYELGKKKKNLSFIAARSPVEEDENYVLFLDGQDNYPLYFRGDTVINYFWPNQYADNYFIRKHK